MSFPIKSIVALACFSFLALPTTADIWATAERPLPPMELTVTASNAGNMLSWEPPLADNGAPLEAYNIYRLVNGVEEALPSVPASQTSFLDSDVSYDGSSSYVYFVTAESASGESVPSNLGLCFVVTFALGPFPSLPSDIETHPDCLKPESNPVIRI